MSEQEWVSKLQQEGLQNVSVFRGGPNMVFGMHTHAEHTVHVLLEGELIITDQNGVRNIRAGGRIEFPAGTMHNAQCGSEGCAFVVGVRR